MGADLQSFLAHGGVGGDIIDIHGSSFGVFGTSDVVICQVKLSPSSQYSAGVCLGLSNDISILTNHGDATISWGSSVDCKNLMFDMMASGRRSANPQREDHDMP